MAVHVSVLAGRGHASIKQIPSANNGWTLIVRFADGYAGAALLTVHISIETMPSNILPLNIVPSNVVSLNIVPIDSAHWQVRWPTNAPSCQLESTPVLPASADGWTVVTNQPVVDGEYFTVPIDMTKSQEFFRLQPL